MNKLLAQYRRDLHQIPEIDFDLPETIRYVSEVLKNFPCRIFSPSKSAVCAYFDCGKERTTAFRADMDALPIQERTNTEYASRNSGRMHACGHDGHMAMVLALGEYISRHMESLPRNILLVFQPAEETTGGASLICKSGVFQQYHVDRIFGMHLWPDLPAGQLSSLPGPLLAQSSEVTLTVTGKSSHIAKAEEGRDALLAAVSFVCRAYEEMDRLAEREPCLLRFGRLESGTARNAISPHSQLLGSLRVFSSEMFLRAKGMLKRLVQEEEEKTGCRGEIIFSEGYPPVRNDEKLFQLATQTLPQLKELLSPLLIAEDFSFYQQTLPGVFFLLGTGTGIPLHADTFDFDESVLQAGLEAYMQLAHLP